MARTYRKSRRAEAQDETRARIVQATMDLHVEQGVATTSFPEVAARAGVGAATVYRHFPTMDLLVEACGTHFWEAIDPPTAERAVTAFTGLESRAERLGRLVDELDSFYARAQAPLWSAVRDQDRVAPLARFLAEVGDGVGALVAEALRTEPESEPARIAASLLDFTVWRSLSASGIDPSRRKAILLAIVEAALGQKSDRQET